MNDDHDCPKCGGVMCHDDSACPPYFCPVCRNQPRDVAISEWLDDAIRDVPEHMQPGIRNYITHRLPPGDFLYAVLSNDLYRASCRADDHNRHALSQWARVLENMPRNIWGSPESVNRHLHGDCDQ